MGPGPYLLLLALIGTAPPRLLVLAQAEHATTDASAAPRAWQMKDQRTLGVCLHVYLERDFPGIERIVYPAGSSPTTANNGMSGAAAGSSSRVLVDGPSLEANCQQLKRLVRCFTRSLPRLQYYENFSEFRRLVVALDAVLLQLCGAVDLMRHRFLPLLQTLNCIEGVRERAPCPYRDRLPANIWHQLVRLELDSTLCWPLMRQLHCVRDTGMVRAHCGETAQHLFTNLSTVFLEHWCLNDAPKPPQLSIVLMSMLILVPILSLLPNFSLHSL